MNKYIFLIDQDNDYETVYNAIPAEKIETLKVTDTYDSYGQPVSPEDAGAGISLNSQKAVDAANKSANKISEEEHDMGTNWEDGEVSNFVYEEYYKIGDYVYAYDNGDIYSAVINECEEGEDYILDVETCQGFNYWDGNNWQSVILNYENNDYYTGWEKLDDEKLELELNDAIENCKYVKEGFGVKTYETDEYLVTQSAFASDWSTYQLTQK